MNADIFEELGFTPAETKIYLALLSLGPSFAGPILHKTKMQNSVGHATLKRLINKGIVSFILINRKKQYRATSPNNLLKQQREKQELLEKTIPELNLLANNNIFEEATIYKGFNGLKNALQDLIINAKKGDEYLIFSLGAKQLQNYENVISYYRSFEDERKQKGIISKAIAPVWQKKFLKDSAKKINILFVDISVPLDISIFQDKILLSSWDTHENTFFLLRSKGLSDNFRAYFYSIWNKYKSKK